MRRTAASAAAVLAFALPALGLAACHRPPPLSSPDAGRTVGVDDADIPFDLEAGFAGAGRLEVAVGVPLSSLAFTLRGDSASGVFRSAYALSVRLVDADGRAPVGSWSEVDTIAVRGKASTERDSSVLHVDTFAVVPGRYTVVAEIEEHRGRRRSERRLSVEVPEAGAAALSVPRLSRCSAGRCVRDVGYYLRAPFDSVSVALRWAGADGVSVRAYRLRRDTTVARPPYWVGPPQGSLAARGLSLDTADAEAIGLRGARRSDGLFEGSVPPIPAGVYAVYARAGEATSSRTFGVASPGFPRPSTLDEAIDALAYIAYAEELRTMRRADSGDERRAAFDAFWARTAGSRVSAERTLQRYYARVAEANRRFTAAKLGWKTDRGMIYVVFGPPAYVEQTFTGEVWHYGASDRLAETFTFTRGAGYGTTGGPFEPYLLERNQAYEQAWRRAVRVWRSGSTG